ncbi:MAG: KTSC domain-containing protein [Marinifilaceae bacterium]
MEMISVNSRNLSSIGYDDETEILNIQFNNGRTYQYFNVPLYEFNNLLNASSKGQYANQNIYKSYSSSEI